MEAHAFRMAMYISYYQYNILYFISFCGRMAHVVEKFVTDDYTCAFNGNNTWILAKKIQQLAK